MRIKIGDVSCSFASRLLEAAELLGADPSELLAHTQIEPQILSTPEGRIDSIDYMRLGYQAIQQTGSAHIGLTAGQQSTITQLGLTGLAAMTSPTLGDAMRNFMRYEMLTSRSYRGQSKMLIDGNDAIFQFYSIAPYNDYNTFVVDAVLATWHKLACWLTNKTHLAKSLHLEFSKPSYHAAYEKVFACPIHYDQPFNGVIIAAAALDETIAYDDPLLHQTLITQCDQALNQLLHAERFTHKVLKVLGPMLHGRNPTIEETAGQLGMPTWTLRRKLKEEDTTFQQLLDNMRKDLALSYMSDPSLSFGEISYILGFSTPGAFQRAFKRWANQTPGEYRKQLKKKTQVETSDT